MSTVQLNNLNKKYSDVEALKQFSLEIQSGELFTLLGPSGCGKTTDVSASGDLPPLSSFKVVPYDFSWSAGNKDLFRRKWNDILIGE